MYTTDQRAANGMLAARIAENVYVIMDQRTANAEVVSLYASWNSSTMGGEGVGWAVETTAATVDEAVDMLSSWYAAMALGKGEDGVV